MGSQQSVALPQTAEEASAQSAPPQRQSSLLMCMINPRVMDPYANQDTMEVDKPSSHSRSSSVNAPPGASSSHVSLSVELLGDSSDVNGEASNKEQSEEQKVVESAMSRIAPPALRTLLADDAAGVNSNIF